MSMIKNGPIYLVKIHVLIQEKSYRNMRKCKDRINQKGTCIQKQNLDRLTRQHDKLKVK